MVSSGVGDVTLVTHVPTRPSVCLQSFVTKFGIVVHHRKPECQAKKKKKKKKRDCIYKVKVTVWVYITKIGVSAISFISFKQTSLLQTNSV